MDREAGGLVDDYEVVVFVDDFDRLRCHRRFMSVEGVRYYVPVLDDLVD